MSRYSEVKPARKNLHYTVSAIPDIQVWRLGQKQKEAERVIWHEAKRAAVIKAMDDGSLIGKQFNATATTKLWNKHFANEKAVHKSIHKDTKSIPIAPQPNLLQRVANALTTWFLSIKF